MATYVEHTACKVKDLDWCVKFFTEVFDMPIRLSPVSYTHLTLPTTSRV